jgi:regulatory factor X 1/2/3
MLSDLNRVDFSNVQDQASWVCQCDPDSVQTLQAEFKATLEEQNGLENWARWLEAVVDKSLKKHESKPNFADAARQFLLRWSFYR